MNDHRVGNSIETLNDTVPSGDAGQSEDPFPQSALHPLPVDWQELATGLHETRLFRIARPDGGGFYWEAEVILNGKLERRRFAGELHARTWLIIAVEPPFTQNSFDIEDINGPLRSSFIAQGR
jgi:hypothetical protein